MRLTILSLQTMLLKSGWLFSAVAAGLFAGRLISELLRPQLAGAVILTLLAILITALAFRHRPFEQVWPALLLLLYVFYPEPDPWVAVATLTLAGIALALQWSADRERLGDRRLSTTAVVVLVGGGFFILYVLTLAPDVLPADSGEFQLVAANLGVAHPPGFALYTVVAHLMTRLPIGASAAYRVSLLSAATSTITIIFVYLSVLKLTRSNLGGLVAAVALGTSTTFWAQSTTANIRSLTGLFAALLIFLLIVLRNRNEVNKTATPAEAAAQVQTFDVPNTRMFTYTALFVLVLSLGLTHHGSLVFMGVVFGIYLLAIYPVILRRPRRWLILMLIALAGLIPLLYFLWRGAQGAQGAPSDLTTVRGLANHVFATGFRGDLFYFLEPTVLWERLKVMINVMSFQFTPLLLAFMIVSLIVMSRQDRLLAFLLGGSFAIHTLVAATYRAPQTVEYMLPAYVPAAICLGYGVGALSNPRFVGRLTLANSRLAQSVAYLVAAVVVVAAASQFFERLPSFMALHHDNSARDYAQFLLDQAPAESVILADWHWVTPLWYLQQVEGHRPDLSVRYVFPTSEAYADTWARRIDEELKNGRPVIATHFDEFAYSDLPPFEPLGEAFLYRQEPLLTLPQGFEPLSQVLGEAIELVGYRLSPSNLEFGQESVLTLAWNPTAFFDPETRFFAHLVGPDGRRYAQQDRPATAQSDGLSLTQFRLTPRPGAAPGQYDLMVGAYENAPLMDTAGEASTLISPVNVSGANMPLFTLNPTYRSLTQSSSAERLVGYDWDNTIGDKTRLYLHWQTEEGYWTEVQDLEVGEFQMRPWHGPWGIELTSSIVDENRPNYYVPFGQGIVWNGAPIDGTVSFRPGESVEISQIFSSSQPVSRDLLASIRLVGFEDDGFHWSWWDLDDSVPAMGAIPTLKWISGSRIRDSHWPTVGEDAWYGQKLGPILLLYDAFTGRPVPILDERISEETPWLPLGTTTVEQ